MMSIRLRFTLLYNAILALTLIVFGTALYAIQVRSTYDALKKDLVHSSETVGNSVLRTITDPGMLPPNSQAPDKTPPPLPFQDFSQDQFFQRLPEREIVRVLDGYGNLVASPFGRNEDALPLSADGLQVLQSGREWWQKVENQGQHLLIYSRPILSDGKVAYIVQVARPLDERDHSLQVLGTTLFTASLITLVIAFGIGWALAGITLQPIHRMIQTAQEIGEKRDFTRRVEHTGPPDEVGQLATTFNSMLARLQDAYQRVAHSLEMQRNFVADVSHELRTPLTTLRGNLGLLRRTPPIPAEEQADILNDMVDESDRLIRLVNDLLVLARADAAQNLAHEPFEIRPVLEETCRQARQIDPGRRITLEADPTLAMIGDRDALKQVLLIALDNALKHSEGDINVSAAEQDGLVEVRVQDRGEGIPPEKLEHVFERFYRGEDRVAIPGFGLGLPIAKALVEGQGGTLRMESQPGQGSTLIAQFPPAIG
jgi:signal transduction histidine kinase